MLDRVLRFPALQQLHRDGEPFSDEVGGVGGETREVLFGVDRADAKRAVRVMRRDPCAELVIAVRHDGDILAQPAFRDNLSREAQVFFCIGRLILDVHAVGFDPVCGEHIEHALTLAHDLVRALSARDDRLRVRVAVEVFLRGVDPLL